MTSATAEAVPRREPLLLRFAGLHPALHASIGVLAAAAGLLLVEWVGEPRYTSSRYFVTMLGLYLAAVPLAVREALQAVEDLAGIAAGGRDVLRREMGRLSVPWMATALAIGVSLHVSILTLLGASLLRLTGAAPGDRLVSIAGWVHALVFAPVLALLMRQAWLFLRLGRSVERVDLLDLASFAPFVRVALRLSLLMAFFAMVMVFYHVDWSRLSFAPQLILIAPVWLVAQAFIFVLPLWGIHTRMREARAGELLRVNAAIRGDRGALRGSLLARDAEGVSTLELLQYRSQVEVFPVWPFGIGTLVRLALYGVIPVLGWVASALVERVVDVVLR